MTDLSLIIGRLLAQPHPKKAAHDGLALSYQPGSPLNAPTLAAGRFGRFPYASEQVDILATLRRCTGRAIIASNRLDNPGGYHIIEYAWKYSDPPAEPVEAEPAETLAEGVEAVEGVKVYQVIRYTSSGLPYTAGVHTNPAEIKRMAARQHGRRDIQTITIYPQPVKIEYGMPLRRTPPCAANSASPSPTPAAATNAPSTAASCSSATTASTSRPVPLKPAAAAAPTTTPAPSSPTPINAPGRPAVAGSPATPKRRL